MEWDEGNPWFIGEEGRRGDEKGFLQGEAWRTESGWLQLQVPRDEGFIAEVRDTIPLEFRAFCYHPYSWLIHPDYIDEIVPILWKYFDMTIRLWWNADFQFNPMGPEEEDFYLLSRLNSDIEDNTTRGPTT